MTRMPNRRALHRWGVALALTGLVGGSVPALAAPRPVSEIVMDARDGSVLYAENAGIVRRPASLTKMMTLLLTFDAIDDGKLDPSGSILISRYAASQ